MSDRDDTMQSLPTVTRFEVIDESGRPYVRYDITAILAYQDEGRTLKVFINPKWETPA